MNEETERQGSKKKILEFETKISELEKTVIALLKGMKEAEEEIGEPLMPQGVYHGFDFTE